MEIQNKQVQIWETFEQLIKYICIGALSVAADIIFLYFFTEFINIWYVISAGFSFLIGLIIVFILNKFWAFKKFSFTKLQLKKFIVLMAFNYVSNMVLILMLTDYFDIAYLFSKIIIILIQTMWNFIFYKFWVFQQ